ncbi:Hpt domain-containing protein [Lentibacter algarum]|uniref:Hpt domain-containing protein n=1 Tax=Lentibacter algarum TaxID=576131 RepID=UPI001C065DB6|nr:Hpt domain-containing protein [Lentibacter algarum]MBU2981086.1 Hpt domain-containing protein [Lentibacter algarum]
MIDWDKVTELKDDIGAEDFDDIVEVFLAEVEDALAKLPSKDLSELEGCLHFLKGCALNLGFSAFSALCQIGEKSAARGSPESIDVRAVAQCYALSKEAFLTGYAP